MLKQAYVQIRFSAKTKKLIELADSVIGEYDRQGYRMTLRQLYYQLVRRNFIPNNQAQYKKLVKTISDARLAGLISWTSIEDTTRGLKYNSHWDHPVDILTTAERQFQVDKWVGQTFRPEVWIEKDALLGVISGICYALDVPFFSCRGYNSQSEMWRAAQRFNEYILRGQIPVVLHLGDHDPSGIDMTRDIIERLEQFRVGRHEREFHIERIALNIDQVRRYDLPPNFAKETDSRMPVYNEEFGEDCWELDALEPATLTELIRAEVARFRDDDKYQVQVDKEADFVRGLAAIRENYGAIVEQFGNGHDLSDDED